MPTRTQPDSAAARAAPQRAARAAFILLILALPALAPSSFAAEDPASQRKKLDALRARIAEVQEVLESSVGERDQANEELRATEREIGLIARKLRVLSGQIERQRSELGDLEQSAMRQERDLDRERAALARQINAAYAMGRQERLKILLNQQDPALISRILAYYDYLNRERARRMLRIRKQLTGLNNTRRAIAARQERLQRLHARGLEDRQRIEQVQEARRVVVARLSARIQNQDRRLNRLRGDEKHLQDLLNGLQKALADIPEDVPVAKKFKTLRGRLDWPAQGVIASAFGSPKIGSLRWDGVMISATEGEEVRAIHHGRVAFADWLRGFGLMLIIDHGDGYMSLYGHNQTLFKEAGDWVEAGEPVAAVGSSGGRESAGVYFGIRYKGKPVNPTRWCRRPGRGKRVG